MKRKVSAKEAIDCQPTIGLLELLSCKLTIARSRWPNGRVKGYISTPRLLIVGIAFMMIQVAAPSQVQAYCSYECPDPFYGCVGTCGCWNCTIKKGYCLNCNVFLCNCDGCPWVASRKRPRRILIGY